MSTCSAKKAVLKKEVAKKKDGKGGPGSGDRFKIGMDPSMTLPPHKQLLGRMPVITGSGPEALSAMKMGMTPGLNPSSPAGKTLKELTVPGKLGKRVGDLTNQFVTQGREGARKAFESATPDKKKALMKDMAKSVRKANKLQNMTQGIKADLPFQTKG